MGNRMTDPATEEQKAEIAGFTVATVLKSVKTFGQAKALLDDKANLGKNIRKSLKVVEPTEDVRITAYKKDIEKFFFETYGQTVDLSNIAFKDSWAHFMVNPSNLTSDGIYEKFKKLELSASKYVNDSIDAKRSGGKAHEPTRPKVLYSFGHKGGDEPDKDHLGESYDQFSVDGKNYMTINEYMLTYQFMWWKFKTKLDKKGWTRTSTLGSDGRVMNGFSNGDWFKLIWNFRVGQHSVSGPREVDVF